MTEQQLKDWTKQLAVQVAALVDQLKPCTATFVYGKQLVRSSSSVGANYRAACRSRSDLEMVAKLGIVEEESDESIYWMELLVEAGLLTVEQTTELSQAYNQIVAIMVASRRTLRKRIDAKGNTSR